MTFNRHPVGPAASPGGTDASSMFSGLRSLHESTLQNTLSVQCKIPFQYNTPSTACTVWYSAGRKRYIGRCAVPYQKRRDCLPAGKVTLGCKVILKQPNMHQCMMCLECGPAQNRGARVVMIKPPPHPPPPPPPHPTPTHPPTHNTHTQGFTRAQGET